MQSGRATSQSPVLDKCPVVLLINRFTFSKCSLCIYLESRAKSSTVETTGKVWSSLILHCSEYLIYVLCQNFVQLQDKKLWVWRLVFVCGRHLVTETLIIGFVFISLCLIC